MNTKKIGRAAIAYVNKLGWSVFPLKPGSKEPLYKGGFHKATKNIHQIKKWWSETPTANIGVPTGSKNNFFVIDVDVKNVDGYESLSYLTDQYGKLPETVQGITASNGSHYLFKYQEGVKNKVDFYPSIDVRGEGGYIVVPPSTVPSGRYEWELSSHPLQLEIANAPNWVLEMLISPKNEKLKAKPTEYWTEIFRGVNSGKRNNSAASLCGYLLKKDITPELVVEIMKLWNQSRVYPPLNVKELERVIDSIAGKELARRQRREGF
ncbi:bifunctional DNA primase/polymerase [Thalassorhabdus alkalitolerans]|uniref:Bifunctional DNA primase/polymerase n=1 Tax=Thalassorhabdus alkalitolerans TaxID=2282697 RepID=A0ABW0YR43_9BACI